MRVPDWYGFTLSFQGVLLEGTEVAFIVLTFGSNQHAIPLAAVAAGAAVLVVGAAGFAVRAPLARVPENALKFLVGVMLTGFGTFWSAEGAGARWPGSDAALLVLLPGIALLGLLLAHGLRRRGGAGTGGTRGRVHRRGGRLMARRLRALVAFVDDLVIGDDWRVALGLAGAIALTAALSRSPVPCWWVLPAAILLLLPLSIWRTARRRS